MLMVDILIYTHNYCPHKSLKSVQVILAAGWCILSEGGVLCVVKSITSSPNIQTSLAVVKRLKLMDSGAIHLIGNRVIDAAKNDGTRCCYVVNIKKTWVFFKFGNYIIWLVPSSFVRLFFQGCTVYLDN